MGTAGTATRDGATTHSSTVPFGRRLLEVILLIALPLAFPLAWVAGVGLLVSRRPAGMAATLAMSPLGLFAPLWLYGHGFGDGADFSPWAAGTLAVLLVMGCFVATWRILTAD